MAQKNNLMPMIIITALFFVFGFVTWLNATLILYLRIACELNNFESYFVTFAFYISYFVMAIPSAWVLQKTGFKKGMMLGLLVMAVGALIFIPAAQTRIYGIFLTGLFIIGTGLSILQTAANPYITILGPIESAARRISIMGIFNKAAGTLAPFVLGAIVLANSDGLTEELKTMNEMQKAARLDELASRVIMPYTVMALVLIALAVFIYFSSLPEIEQQEETAEENKPVQKSSVLQFPNLVLGVIAIFLYVGVEVIAADTLSNYGQSQGFSLSVAKNFASYTLAAMMLGYIIGIFTIPKYIKQEKALTISAITGILFSIIAIFTSGFSSVLFIALLGIANALMWPAIWPLAINGLGRFTKIGSSLLIMGIAGGAILPLVYGKIADAVHPQQAYWIMVPCYLFILFYATAGHKLK